MLCAWEPDLARRFAINKRRLALLAPLSELNEKAYAQIVRQVTACHCRERHVTVGSKKAYERADRVTGPRTASA